MPRSFSPAQRVALAIVDGLTCARCDAPLEPGGAHADHIRPYSRGGATEVGNARLLCARCNLSLGASNLDGPARRPDFTHEVPTIDHARLRFGQARLLAAMRSAAESGGRAFAASMSVGSGKTIGGLAAFANVLAPRYGRPLLVVLAPRVKLLAQWRKSAAAFGLRFVVGADAFLGRAAERGEVHGVGITYQSANANPDVLASLCDRFDAVVVRDECQWLADSNLWGRRVADAIHDEVFGIGLTGTPFRTDPRERLVGFDYADDRAVIDFEHSYAHALAQRECPRLTWTAIGGRVVWSEQVVDAIDKGESAFGEDEERTEAGAYINEALINRRLRLSVHASPDLISGFLLHMLNEADAHLTEVRREHRNAGGIVFAARVEGARRVAAYLRSIGRRAVVVAGEGDQDADTDAFAAGDAEWIVTCKKLSEGVDIPRLRVAVLASADTSARALIQQAGRLLRLDPGVPHEAQDVRAFCPADPRIVEALERFGEPTASPTRAEGEEAGERDGDGERVFRVLLAVGADSLEVASAGSPAEARADDVAEAVRAMLVADGLNAQAWPLAVVEFVAQVRDDLQRNGPARFAGCAPGPDLVSSVKAVLWAMGADLSGRTGLSLDESVRAVERYVRGVPVVEVAMRACGSLISDRFLGARP